MENTIGTRIKELRLHYNMDVKEFAAKCKLSAVSVYNLESDKTSKPHFSSLRKIAATYNSPVEWILYGRGEMFPGEARALAPVEISMERYWKEETYLEMKNKNEMLQREIERLWSLIQVFTDQSKSNLHQIKKAG